MTNKINKEGDILKNIYCNYSNDILDEYAIYLRKSRADMEAEAKGEGETLARHEKYC